MRQEINRRRNSGGQNEARKLRNNRCGPRDKDGEGEGCTGKLGETK